MGVGWPRWRTVRMFLAGACLVLTGSPGWAIDLIVNATDDRPDAAPGTGGCATSVGTCTLRAAVMEANGNGSGADRVVLSSKTYWLTVGGTGDDGGDLDVTSTIEIAGAAGATIVALHGLDRVLEVSGGGQANVHDVALVAHDVGGNPACLLAMAPLVATNVTCKAPDLPSGDSFESGDLGGWSAHAP